MPSQAVRQRATGRVTLADVALAAGVSPITVSRALRGERAVDPVLVDRVQAAARKLGYVPDPAARALASQRSTHVAVLIPMLSNALFVDLLEAVQRSLRRAGYQTLIGVTHYDPGEEEQLLREQLHAPSGRPAGHRASTAREAHAPTDRAQRRALRAPDGKQRRRGIYSVGFSQSDAAADLTRHLIGRGQAAHRLCRRAARPAHPAAPGGLAPGHAAPKAFSIRRSNG